MIPHYAVSAARIGGNFSRRRASCLRARVTSWNYAVLNARKGYRAEQDAARATKGKKKKKNKKERKNRPEEKEKKRRKRKETTRSRAHSRERESPSR